MRPEEFVQRYEPLWQSLEASLDPAKRDKKAARNVADLATWPSRYRQACQHLELARERHYPIALIERLNHIVVAGQAHLYGARDTVGERFLNFIVREFPQLVRREWRVFTLASVLFFGSFLGTAALGYYSTDFAEATIGRQTMEQFDEMYGSRADRLGNRGAEDDVMMFGFYIYNNIKIGFQTFASGLLLGLGTLFFLLFNGIQIGTTMGYVATTENATRFFSFVAGHGSFELTAIALCGAAGLMLGRAVAFPGQRRRLDALAHEASSAIKIVYGAGLFLLVAAFIEAFWSAKISIDPAIKYAVGAALWLFVILYLAIAGRQRADR
jgi:uncharacterized membrane protein SpoIIM required for sporulation